MQLLVALGHELRLPHSRAWGTGCTSSAMSEPAYRLFYMLLPGDRAVLLGGMTKKRDDIPDATIKRLRALQRAVHAELKKPKKGR